MSDSERETTDETTEDLRMYAPNQELALAIVDKFNMVNADVAVTANMIDLCVQLEREGWDERTIYDVARTLFADGLIDNMAPASPVPQIRTTTAGRQYLDLHTIGKGTTP